MGIKKKGLSLSIILTFCLFPSLSFYFISFSLIFVYHSFCLSIKVSLFLSPSLFFLCFISLCLSLISYYFSLLHLLYYPFTLSHLLSCQFTPSTSVYLSLLVSLSHLSYPFTLSLSITLSVALSFWLNKGYITYKVKRAEKLIQTSL